MTMTVSPPPQLQSQAIYNQTVQELTGVDASVAEQAVVDLTADRLLIEIKSVNARLRHQFSPDGASLFLKRRSGHVTSQDLDQLLALSRIYADVRMVMDEADAAHWLTKPNRHLDGQTPLALLLTRTGERRVRDYLDNLLTGNFA